VKSSAWAIIVVAVGLIGSSLWLVSKYVPGEALEYQNQIVISLPIEECWRQLKDLSLAHNYVPDIVHTELTTTSKTGAGASRRVYSADDSYINESVIEWQAGSGFTLQLHDDAGLAPFPFSNATFRYQLERLTQDETALTTRLHFTLRGGWVGQWLGSALLSGTFQQRVDEIAKSLKQYYER
jgi:Polyketide cyclase / dehydrase and lipid transport